MNNFYFTRRALLDIQNIYSYSIENWGEDKADEYVSNLYKDFNKITNKIELGELRKERSNPFLMFPSGRHYIIYEPFKDGIIIITLLHQMRNIKNIIQEFGSTFYNEIQELKINIKNKI
jgi:toxin ParE1/3/4